MKKDTKRKILRTLIVLGVLALLFLAIFLPLYFTGALDKIRSAEELQKLILSGGVWSYLIFFVIQFLQVTFLPIPGAVTTVAGTLIFGPWITLAISFVAVMLASAFSFYLGRKVGKKLVVWIAGEKDYEKWAEKLGKGKFVFFLMMLLPVFPDDILCMIVGTTKMEWKFFLLTNLITRPIGIACTCFLGSGIIPFEGWWLALWAVLAIACLVLFILAYKFQPQIEGLVLKWAKKFEPSEEKKKQKQLKKVKRLQKRLGINSQTLNGKTVAITGSTGGLGRYISSFVAQLGGDLILLDRNKQRSEDHAKELSEKYNVNAKTITVDMVDIDSVKKMCQEIQQEKVDVLILNAGAYNLPRTKASTGLDQSYQINFLSPYYIVKEMLDNLAKQNGRVVVVGSIAHKGAKIREDDVDFSNDKSKTRVYGNAKRFLMFSLSELLKNEDRIKFSITHPGITATNITSNYSKFVRAIVKYPMKLIFTSPRNASLNVVKGIFEDCPYKTWIGPRMFDIWGKPKLKALKTCSDEESYKIFTIAEELFEKMKKSM